jgi:hypothetical protein
MPTALQLLQGFASAVVAWQSTRAGLPARVQAPIINSCGSLLLLLQLLYVEGLQPRQHDMFASMVVACNELVNTLVNGSGCGTSDSDGGCSCCLDEALAVSGSARGSRSAAPLLAFSKSDSRVRSGPLGFAIESVLQPLRVLHMAHNRYASGSSSEMRLPASRGGLLLHIQHLCICLMHARHQITTANVNGVVLLSPAAAPGRGDSSSSSSTSTSGGSSGAGAGCAELAPFIGDARAASFPAMYAAPEGPVIKHAGLLTAVLDDIQGAPGAPHACGRCFPHQLLLILEAGTMPGVAACDRSRQAQLLNWVCNQVVNADLPAWQAPFTRRAVPTLAAWVLAAAQQLPSAASQAARVELAMQILHAASVVLLSPGALLQSPHTYPSVLPDMGRLTAAVEAALRSVPAGDRPHAWLGGWAVLMVRMTTG